MILVRLIYDDSVDSSIKGDGFLILFLKSLSVLVIAFCSNLPVAVFLYKLSITPVGTISSLKALSVFRLLDTEAFTTSSTIHSLEAISICIVNNHLAVYQSLFEVPSKTSPFFFVSLPLPFCTSSIHEPTYMSPFFHTKVP